jgi:hypothetical protein
MLFVFCAFPSQALADGGPDGGDTDTEDTDYPFCEMVSDPCCLDNGSDADVLDLAGCHGEPYGPAEVGALAGECTYDPDDAAGLGNCVGIAQCWNFRKWFDPTNEAEGGECGLCLEICTNFSNCPDGVTDAFSYDFCTSSCPDGMRCWVYQYEDNKRGLCMADCEEDEDCSSGICDPLWKVCVPRQDWCPLPEDTDTWDDTDTWPESDGGNWDSGAEPGPDEGGCVCSPAPPRRTTSLFGLLLDVLTR